jgi:hypothetical protein
MTDWSVIYTEEREAAQGGREITTSVERKSSLL